LLGPRARGTVKLNAAEPSLVPDERCRTTVHRQIHERNERSVLHLGDDAALGTSDVDSLRFEVDDEGLSVVALDAPHPDIR
jgi:hypothetical protein